MFLSGILSRRRHAIKQSRYDRFVRIIPWLLTAAWMGGIFYLSHQTAPLGQTAGAQVAVAAHVGVYAGLAGLLTWAIHRSMAGARRTILWTAVAFAAAVLYGLSDEYHQSFISGRTASGNDLGLDAAGAALGSAALLAAIRLRRSWP